MEQTLLKVAEQLPSAVLVVSFMVWVLRWVDKRDQIRDERLAKHDFEIQAALDKRDDLMRAFWEGQQNSNRETLERLTQGVEQIITTLQEHDRRAEAAIVEMRSKLPPPKASRPTPTKPRL